MERRLSIPPIFITTLLVTKFAGDQKPVVPSSSKVGYRSYGSHRVVVPIAGSVS